MNKAQLMGKIRSLSFAKCEAELFLDTHPHCREALDYYRNLTSELMIATAEYEAKFGPITAAASRDGWSWVDTPWPWQLEANEDAELISRVGEDK